MRRIVLLLLLVSSLCNLCVLCDSVVIGMHETTTTESQRTQRLHREIQLQLTQSEAVELAEKFIAQNGYTDLPPDKTKLTYETIEWEGNVDKLLELRHDTLERRAYGFRSGRKGSERGWTVVFRYKHASNPQAQSHGRAVTMNLDGSKPRVEHVDFILKYATKL